MNKFKIDDKVKVVADKEALEERRISDLSLIGRTGIVTNVYLSDENNAYDSYMVNIDGSAWCYYNQDLELVEPQPIPQPVSQQEPQNAGFRVRETDDEFDKWTVADGPDYKTSDNYVNSDGTVGLCKSYSTKAEAQTAFDLYLKKQQEPERTSVGHPDGELEVIPDALAEAGWKESGGTGPPIRTFDTGATRDTTQGKLDYVKALSPIVIRRYVQYLDKHRLQPDGSYRDFDNWKKGIPQETYHSSNGRHFVDAWLLLEGYTAEDNHGPIEIEDVLCAQMFNVMGQLHEILKAKLAVDRTKPVPGGY